CCGVEPGARCLLTTPEKMMSVACPMNTGPTEESATLTTPNITTAVMRTRSGRSSPRSRRVEGQKFIDFSVGTPTCIQGGPPRPAGCPAGGSRLGMTFEPEPLGGGESVGGAEPLGRVES